ncbi:Helix-turn-helix domain [Mycobacteroides abscessus subsp. abscessus]|nr:Helix-turn-helix domain [Mycobacteroides abscessus subsp. abscessus]
MSAKAIPDLMSIDEVSDETGVAVATLRWWRATGGGGPRSAKLGRRVVYRRSDVEAWIDAAFEETK